MNGSLVPANTKKSLLIFSMFRLMADLIILVAGVLTTIILLLIFNSAGTLTLIGCSLPMMLAVILVLPIPNYHNTLVAIQSILRFYGERRNYIWKGWCVYSEYKNDK